MSVKRIKTTRKISPQQLSKMLHDAWKKGEVGDEIQSFIKTGLLPIEYLREELRWILTRGECGNLFLTTEQELD